MKIEKTATIRGALITPSYKEVPMDKIQRSPELAARAISSDDEYYHLEKENMDVLISQLARVVSLISKVVDLNKLPQEHQDAITSMVDRFEEGVFVGDVSMYANGGTRLSDIMKKQTEYATTYVNELSRTQDQTDLIKELKLDIPIFTEDEKIAEDGTEPTRTPDVALSKSVNEVEPEFAAVRKNVVGTEIVSDPYLGFKNIVSEVSYVPKGARQQVIDEILSQSPITIDELTPDDRIIIDKFINLGVKDDVLGTYGDVTSGRNIYTAIVGVEAPADTSIVLNEHIDQETTFNTALNEFSIEPTPRGTFPFPKDGSVKWGHGGSGHRKRKSRRNRRNPDQDRGDQDIKNKVVDDQDHGSPFDDIKRKPQRRSGRRKPTEDGQNIENGPDKLTDG